MKKVTIVNKFGPASNAITGKNAKELADYLFASGIEVKFVCLQAEYVSSNKAEETSLPYSVKELRSVYSGRSPGIRFVASLVDGFRLWLATPGGPVIVMTDPPLLFMWFQLFRIFSKRKLIYWTMDLYPEAFVAGGYIKSSNIVYKIFHKLVYGRPPDLAIVLGEQQADYLRKKFGKAFPEATVPCGIIEKDEATPHTIPQNRKIVFGYGGNMGEAHDAEFLIAFARQLDPEKHTLIASLYGSKAPYVKEQITGLPVVEFRPFLNLDDIASLDVNIASLLPEWNHICVPSKAVTAICCGSALLLNATPDADNWQMFAEAGWTVPAGKNYTAAINQVLALINPETIAEKKQNARRIAKTIQQEKSLAYDAVAKFILSA